LVEVERRIAAPPEVVFSYFTDPERYRLWQGVDAELDPRPGGVFRIHMTGRTSMVVSGAYVDVEPPTRVSFTWGWEPSDALDVAQRAVGPGSSTVEVVLVPDGDGTVLRLRHTGLPTEAAFNFHSSGWELTIDRLERTASGVDGDPNPFLDL
jgi:uncharacterized protein YndB with AHSA1/START domain